MGLINVDLSSLSGKDLLSLAEKRTFFLGMEDLGSNLSYRNMCYGLGKMMYALGSEDVYCVFAPDASITRNKGRWLSGYGYGGVIKWNDDVGFPEIRPNGCGMLLMRLDGLPDIEELVKRASEVNDDSFTLDGIEIEPDFGKGNHFFEFYESMGSSGGNSNTFPEDAYFAILHCSGPELKDEIYSYAYEEKRIETPFGKITVLEDSEAEEYYEQWKRLESFSRRRRKFLAEKIVGSFDPISNFTHQGLFSKNEARLGCYDTLEGSGENHLFPLALRWDCPVYIFRGKKNLSEEVLERTGFRERAEKLGLVEELKNINILPHGGGYELKLSHRDFDVTNTSFGNVYTLKNPVPESGVREDGSAKQIEKTERMTITNPRELPYTYRGEEVARRTMELDLSDLVAKLRPILTLKI